MDPISGAVLIAALVAIARRPVLLAATILAFVATSIGTVISTV
jgi:hypothetical protein